MNSSIKQSDSKDDSSPSVNWWRFWWLLLIFEVVSLVYSIADYHVSSIEIYIYEIYSLSEKFIWFTSLHFRNQVLFVYFYVVYLLSNSLRAEVELKTFKIAVFGEPFYRIYLKLKYRTNTNLYFEIENKKINHYYFIIKE